MPAYAHTVRAENDALQPPTKWEPLFSEDCPALDGRTCPACEACAANHGHLNKVAYLAGEFAARICPPGSDCSEIAHRWGQLSGWWHDLGKFAPRWQDYLKSAADPHAGELAGRVDHSTAGAQHAASCGDYGPLMAYLIAGHHAGLPDGLALFDERLKKAVEPWREEVPERLPLDGARLDFPLKRSTAGIFGAAVHLRLLFSCLVDADFLSTEVVMNPGQAAMRPTDISETKVLEQMSDALDAYYSGFPTPGPEDIVNTARAAVHSDCLKAASLQPGFFSLTVPTGGGKTLASLAFALRHALAHGLRRVIYVIPYTSIIEQNAAIYRGLFTQLGEVLGRPVVVEHHSNLSAENETVASRLLAENWDTPLVVTTNVQFFESLFANRPARCRKLHNIARSVVILDEAQALPTGLLKPVLETLKALVADNHVSVVLCTATQPALEKTDTFEVGLPTEAVREIIPQRDALFHQLARVQSRHLGTIDRDALCAHVIEQCPSGALVIVNTTRAARELYERLREGREVLHLSARMCPVHRRHVLSALDVVQKRKQPHVLVSTQLIEAGVDVSFPVVFRELCGLDSFAQAAGRCNRNGELRDGEGQPRLGTAWLFEFDDVPLPTSLRELRRAADITRLHILPNFDEDALLSLEAVQAYFSQAIWQAGAETGAWDKGINDRPIMEQFKCGSGAEVFHLLKFKTAAEAFKLIDAPTHPVLIPWGDEGEQLRKTLEDCEQTKRPLCREVYRKLQGYTVSVYAQEFERLSGRLVSYADGTIQVLADPSQHYCDATGLVPAPSPHTPDVLIH
ncbi:MAG: CRISPR-associated helicase Cas3' [Opitutales bacterium]